MYTEGQIADPRDNGTKIARRRVSIVNGQDRSHRPVRQAEIASKIALLTTVIDTMESRRNGVRGGLEYFTDDETIEYFARFVTVGLLASGRVGLLYQICRRLENAHSALNDFIGEAIDIPRQR